MFLFFLCLCSGGDPEHQLRGDGAQLSFASSSSSCLQAVLCVPGQVIWLSLWSELLRGLQGKLSQRHMESLQDMYEVKS